MGNGTPLKNTFCFVQVDTNSISLQGIAGPFSLSYGQGFLITMHIDQGFAIAMLIMFAH